MLAITNGLIITPEGIVSECDLIIDGAQIVKIVPTRERIMQVNLYHVVDAQRGYIAPGFIDIHADYIEHMTAPRPSSLMPFELALREAERELLSHGVTTMYHSLSLYKLNSLGGKPIREPKNVNRLINLIKGTSDKKHLIRHRFHARFELDNVDGIDALKGYLHEGKVDLLSFMDHTPGQGQYRDMTKYQEITKGYGHDGDEASFKKRLEERQQAPKLTLSQCRDIAKVALERDIAIASHDDDCEEKINNNIAIGATISEFPVTLEVARYAKSLGQLTIAGAPNVVLGGSHSGNLAAHEAIEHGLIDILCSDYYPAALLHAVFKLHRDYGHPLHEMIKLVTLNPAKAVGIEHKSGSIEPGKVADVIIVNFVEEALPVVTSCFVNGEHVFEMRYRV